MTIKWITNTQHFECAHCGAEKTVRHYEDMDYERCEHRQEWLCFDCATKHPSEESKCKVWFSDIGIMIMIFLMMGCGARHYVPKVASIEPCENLRYPFRPPAEHELDIVNMLKNEGKCEDLRAYLGTLK